MFAEERKEEIMRLLKENKRVSSAELSERFHVSGTTVRTYLMELEKAGRLIRTHGGALLNDDILNVEESIAARKQKCLREKQKAAAKARSMIKDGDTILLDSGTTMLELAKLLKDAKNLTVVTNDLPSAMELQKMEGVYLILIGGHVRTAFESTVGSMGMKFLENISVEKAFMSSDGVSHQGCHHTKHGSGRDQKGNDGCGRPELSRLRYVQDREAYHLFLCKDRRLRRFYPG